MEILEVVRFNIELIEREKESGGPKWQTYRIHVLILKKMIVLGLNWI